MNARRTKVLSVLLVAACALPLAEGELGAQVDKKSFGGNACRATNGAQQTNLLYGGSVLNASGTFTNVMCPIYRDDTLNEDGFAYLEVRIFKQYGDPLSCTANCAVFNSQVESNTQAASVYATSATLVFDDFGSGVNGQCQIRCGLPGGAGVRLYEWHE